MTFSHGAHQFLITTYSSSTGGREVSLETRIMNWKTS